MFASAVQSVTDSEPLSTVLHVCEAGQPCIAVLSPIEVSLAFLFFCLPQSPAPAGLDGCQNGLTSYEASSIF